MTARTLRQIVGLAPGLHAGATGGVGGVKVMTIGGSRSGTAEAIGKRAAKAPEGKARILTEAPAARSRGPGRNAVLACFPAVHRNRRRRHERA